LSFDFPLNSRASHSLCFHIDIPNSLLRAVVPTLSVKKRKVLFRGAPFKAHLGQQRGRSYTEFVVTLRSPKLLAN
jgi:hypothetical protein